VRYLNKLAKRIPIVLLPLCNPSGYRRDWRYPTQRRRSNPDTDPSVGSSEHFLIDDKQEKQDTNMVAKEIQKKYLPMLFSIQRNYPSSFSP